ncbi:MAG: hypothetical protein M3P14_10230 [Chloroflexota bacterium]|nr:hypothetical protein [Chloroflexota bacterium]
MESFAGEVELTWNALVRSLDDGWDLSLRCQSTGLAAEQRSETWMAVAEGPAGASLEGRGDDPIAAMTDLLNRVQG